MNDTSKRKLATAHNDLQLLANAVDKIFPIQVTCGERNAKEQNTAKKNGKSELGYPNSKHNINLKAGRRKAWAIDCVPDPDRNPATLDWNDIAQFEIMCATFEQVADELDIKIRLGRDFKFVDLPHVELI